MTLLEPIDFANGLFSLIFVIISIFVGIRIILNYFKHKRREFILVGLAWICVSEPWWPSAISFILVLISGQGLSFEMYVIIGNVALPLGVTVWIAAFSELLFKRKQKITIILTIILGIIFEIIFFYLLFTEPTLIGELRGPIDIEYKFLALIFLLSFLFLVLILGIIFAVVSIKADNPEVSLQGKFLLISFISWSIGALFDATFHLNLITLAIIRILLVSSAIEWYLGFLLPKWLKKILIKEE